MTTLCFLYTAHHHHHFHTLFNSSFTQKSKAFRTEQLPATLRPTRCRLTLSAAPSNLSSPDAIIKRAFTSIKNNLSKMFAKFPAIKTRVCSLIILLLLWGTNVPTSTHVHAQEISPREASQQNIRVCDSQKNNRSSYHDAHLFPITEQNVYHNTHTSSSPTLVATTTQQDQKTSTNTTTPKKKKIIVRKVKKAKTPIEIVQRSIRQTTRSFSQKANQILTNLQNLHVPTADALILLVTTVIVIPIMRRFNMSPILGFLAASVVLGPTGLNLISDLHSSHVLAEFGVVFFLFEMGLELSTAKLKALQADVFGLGTLQFFVSGAALAGMGFLAGLPTEAAVIVGGSLALSSSAFVLQLLAEKGQIGSRFGRASLGILLFQDLAVVPLVVLTPLLAGGGGGGSALARAISLAAAKGVLALVGIVVAGKLFLEPLFRFVKKSNSEEAFVALIFFTAIATSTLTQCLGLSDTLGAFLAGVMLAETKYCHKVEADIKPVRGLLLGIFFITVGFSIDLRLAFAKAAITAALIIGLLTTKAVIITAIMVLLGRSKSNAIRTGLLLAQGGEFAFVVLGLAQKCGVLPLQTTQLLLLVTALTMALTPTLDSLGANITSSFQNSSGLMGSRMDVDVSPDKEVVVVAGFGRVGRSICKVLNSKLVEYVAFDTRPSVVIDAKKDGLPVFFGDARKPEIFRKMGLNQIKAYIITLDDQAAALQAVTLMRREYPETKIFCRATDAKGQKLMQLAGADSIVSAMVEASYSLGGAVLLYFGVPVEEVNALIDEKRQEAFTEIANESGDASTASFFGTDIKPITNSEVLSSFRPKPT